MLVLLFMAAMLNGCDTGPSGQTIRELEKVMILITNYSYGDSRAWLQEYYDIMAKVYNDESIRQKAEHIHLNALKSGLSPESTLLICRTLSILGDKSSIPVLEKLLLNPETSHAALIALAGIGLEEAENLLIQSLEHAQGDQLVEIINVLGIRKSATAVAPLGNFLFHEDVRVAAAAANSLAAIGGESAVNQLYEAFKKAQDRNWPVAEALIKVLEHANVSESDKMYESILAVNPPISIKTAAIAGMLDSRPADSRIDFLIKVLMESDAEFQEALIPVIRNMPVNISMEPLSLKLSGFSDSSLQKMMVAIADRGDVSVRNMALDDLKSNNAEIRAYALLALKTIALPEDIPVLARIAASSNSEETTLARACLYWMDSETTDAKILSELKNADGKVKAELIRAAGYRKIEASTDDVLSMLTSSNRDVRLASIETLGKIASIPVLNEAMEKMLNNMIAAESEAIAVALTTIVLNSGDPDGSLTDIYNQLDRQDKVLQQTALITVLGRIGSEKALNYILPYLRHNNTEIQFACLRTLSYWQNSDPLKSLEEFISFSSNDKNRQQAYVGIVNLTQQSETMNNQGKAEKLEAVFATAQSNPEKIILINGISRINTYESLDFVQKFLDQQGLEQASKEAFIRLADELRYNMDSRVVSKIDTVMTTTADEAFREKLMILKRSLEL